MQQGCLSCGTQQARVSLPLRPRDRSVWDSGLHAWSEVNGAFEVFVGGSSRNTPLTAHFDNNNDDYNDDDNHDNHDYNHDDDDDHDTEASLYESTKR